ncbi:LytR/AlgR family response regulator transcription factor [Mucilaginibacter aquaedulcis]|uniref:LytR/AlgR family response regulator transcription factor n=1 Tax=Mucilaginibacter aquaedulcis TaxID=1187081 RepID=UPI0025B341D9|nr:LytTR family DNA-binding domain-containing protein [Mucilaginibacter aquaedulcis]MDN3548911.1 LytTR family DNA-binding domain-containing protein [Mucilaginibacter aquaedulcis]
MTLTSYIIDDEPHAVELLRNFVTMTPGLELAGTATDPLEALTIVSSGIPPQLIFLDVDMPELSGLDFAALVNHRSIIIFVTSYREYALEAFEQQAVDYLLKPISYERFLKCIQKIRRNINFGGSAVPGEGTFLFARGGVGNKYIKIDFNQISHITAALNYVEIHIKEQSVITYMSMTDILEKLPAADFSRIHKSHIVNHHFIASLDYGYLTTRTGNALPIGRVFRKEFHQKMKASFSGGKYDERG